MRGLTIVFDLDGTLVDTAPDLVAATNHALGLEGIMPVPASVLTPWVSHGARRMLVEGLRHSALTLTEPDVDRLLGRFLTYYEANIAVASRTYEGAVPALLELKQAGAKLAVCTNKREQLSKLLLRELDIAHHFDAIAGRDTFSVSKPHPDHLLGTVSLAGGNPQRSIMVGDTSVDIETAGAAGIPSIAVSFGYSQVPAAELGAGMTIDHYRDLSAAVAALYPPYGRKAT